MSNKTEIDPVFTEQPGHGNSIAAWVCVCVMIAGSVAGGVAFALHKPTIVYLSVGIILVGLLLGWIMKLAGFGVGGPRSGAKH